MDKFKIGYLVSTGLLTLMMCFSAGMYIFNNDQVVMAFEKLGYPTYIIYPLAVAKILGLVAIWSRKSTLLLNLAYAGFFYNVTLAFFAHVMIGDGEFAGALMGFILAVSSFFTQRKHFA